MFHQSPEMRIEEKYEDSIINLCVRVLQYLDRIKYAQSCFSRVSPDDLASCAARIADADAACRGFTVILASEVVQHDQGNKRVVEIVENEDDEDFDSDSTLVQHQTSVGMIPSAKRVKI